MQSDARYRVGTALNTQRPTTLQSAWRLFVVPSTIDPVADRHWVPIMGANRVLWEEQRHVG
jgi:hypothetical protein